MIEDEELPPPKPPAFVFNLRQGAVMATCAAWGAVLRLLVIAAVLDEMKKREN